MPEQESTIVLSIRETGTPAQRAFLFHILVDGEVVASNQSLSPDESQAVRAFSRRYHALFEQRYAPRIAADNLKALGAELFNLWLAQAWGKIAAKVPSGARRLLVIASDVPDVLNLPWELLRPADGDFIGFDPKFSVRRLPWPDRPLAPFTGPLPPRPLRILFMACAPQDQPPLDYDREEEFLLRAIAKAGPNVAFDSGDLGTFDELRERINDFRPHIVHLTGHGVLGRKCPACGRLNKPEDETCQNHECAAPLKDVPVLGYFAFEDERGQTDLHSSVEIRQHLFAGSGVQCAFISGCQTGKAPPVAALGGICQGLVGDVAALRKMDEPASPLAEAPVSRAQGGEVPLAIGWAASIADDLATRFATTFYNTLAAGQPVDRALVQARQAIRQACEERGDPSWTLPVLYTATAQGLVFDPDPHRPAEPPPRSMMDLLQPLPGMTEGYAEHFVGRRREQQRLLPALREGTLQTVLITGLGGAGKSTLATRLARKLKADGFTPIPVPSSPGTPLSAARLLQICGDAFLAAGLRDAHAILRDANLSVDDRLRYVVTALNRERFVLVLDNFEVNVDEATRCILDRDLAGFYTHLLTHLAGGSRALITCRYRPADLPALPQTAHEEALGDFPEASFIKFLLRDEVVEQRYYRDELPHDLLSELHRLLGGTPRFLDQIRKVLKTITADDLRRELAAVKLPAEAKPGVLRKERDRYCEKIFTARLYGYLSAKSSRALSRAAVYGVPVNLAGLAAVTGEPVETLRGFTRQWQDYALAYPLPSPDVGRGAGGEGLWQVPGLLRGWLLAPERLSPDERRAAHKAAGDFLRDLVEKDRTAELGLHPLQADLEARAQYLAAGDREQARAVTDRISGFLVLQGLYDGVVRLNRELLECEEHPGPMNWIGQAYYHRGNYDEARGWFERLMTAAGEEMLAEKALAWHQLASIDLNVGDYGAAREKFQKALAMLQQLGDRAGEAATWHQLATIDVHQGDYGAAREKFQKALAMLQQLGDRAGEAATFAQLGILAAQLGRSEAGLRLVTLSAMLLQSLGHADLKRVEPWVNGLASQLNYTQGQFQAMLRQVAEAYRKDGGRGLVEAAFGDVNGEVVNGEVTN
jgi:tetratricopeptide (TPR) repeat protein